MSDVRRTIDIEVITCGLEIGQPDVVNGPAVTVELDSGVTIGVIPGLHYSVMTEDQYEELQTIDSDKFYFLLEEE